MECKNGCEGQGVSVTVKCPVCNKGDFITLDMHDAAPELLQALELAERAMHVQAETRGCKRGMVTAIKQARKAIAKAKGLKYGCHD